MGSWNGIDEFVAVASAGSFVAGARKVGASTAHMSRSVAQLENRLQAQLLHRTTRIVRLTDTGRIFFEHCQRLMTERDEAVALISERGEPQGGLRITCSVVLGERFVGPIIRQFAEQYPRLSVTIELTDEILDLVDGGYDLAVRIGSLPDSRLIATRVGSYSIYTCASRRYLESAGLPHAIADLGQHQCLLGGNPAWRFTVGQQHELYRPKGRWRSNSSISVVEAAVAGMGICQQPDFAIRSHLASGALLPVLERLRPCDEPIWAVYPERRHLMPKVSLLVERVRDQLPTLLADAGPILD
jgi:DNA-binding transcriptional LysR family regulator